MGKRIKILWILIIGPFIFIPGVCFGDETEIFSSAVEPDALILLDLSGSMAWDPAGNVCWRSGCSRLDMAKAAIKEILDDDNSGTIDDQDETSLQVRIGYMRFYDCSADDTGKDYYAGCIRVRSDIPNTDPPPFSSPSRYSDIWSWVNRVTSGSGGTPLASALNEAKLYLDHHRNNDTAKACRQKFVILITDGQDTLACDGDGTENQTDMHKRRKATVAQAKALKDAGYKVFVVGFGTNMPAELKNTLNWTAYYGGTDNPAAAKSGNTGAITPSSNPCGQDPSNDPGNAALSGYAFMATNAAELSAALKRTFGIISESRISFTVSSVAASRVTSENFLYEASFQPVSGPSWVGHLKKYSINADATVGNVIWDAGNMLQSRDPSDRKMYTYLTGAVTSFVSDIFSDPGQAIKYLNVQTGNEAQAVVGYIRGEPAYNPDNWKLGDIFHSNPITIGSPSAYFSDIRYPQAFVDFRNSHASRERIVVVGANDGQFHAFNGSDGSEKWSFIPPNFLPKLKYIAHSTNPTNQQHTYFTDGPVIVADVWLGAGDGRSKSAGDWQTLLVFGEGKGVRDATNTAAFLWSSSSSCDSDFNKSYTSSKYQFYCGYYAFDVTDTSASTPVFKWRLNFPPGAPQTQQYLDEPWSRMAIGRVIIGGYEKWVGFIGGGYNNDNDPNKGKGFFVVDLRDGGVLWSFTRGSGDSRTTSSHMTYSIPASPAVVDTDNDGFIDTAYVGDLGGNMWRFKFCTEADTSSCNTGNWSGGLLFQATTGFIQPIYTTAAVARGSIWVFWGTGNKENPAGSSGMDHFFALQDNDPTATYTIGYFQDITTEGTTYSGAQNGWYITLSAGEKMLSDPTVFGGIVLFTTYTPTTSSSDLCTNIGTGKLYALAMMRIAIGLGGYKYDPGAGVLSTPGSPGSTAGGARGITLGSGVVKGPIISQKLAGGPTDLYVSLSGGGGQDTKIIPITSSAQLQSSPLAQRFAQTAPSSQLLHWKDGRIQ